MAAKPCLECRAPRGAKCRPIRMRDAPYDPRTGMSNVHAGRGREGTAPHPQGSRVWNEPLDGLGQADPEPDDLGHTWTAAPCTSENCGGRTCTRCSTCSRSPAAQGVCQAEAN